MPHKVILWEIQTQLLTLETEFWTNNYWVAGPLEKSLSCLFQKKQGLPWLNWRHRRCWCLRYKKSSWTWVWATREKIELRSKLSGLVYMDPFQFTLQFTVEWLNLTPHILVKIPEPGVLEPGFPLELLTHPVASTSAQRLTTYGNPLPHIWESPKNLTILLMESSPKIWFYCPFSLKLSVKNSLTIPSRVSTRTVRWTSRQIPSISQHNNLWIWISIPLTHWIKAPVSWIPLTELEGLRMSPIGAC